MAEHKHAEVLRAIADGKATQWRVDQEWFDASDCSGSLNPLSCQAFEWRIKPESKPNVVRYVAPAESWGYGDLEKLKQLCPNVGSFLRMTYDGETGKLKSVEIVE